MNFCETLVIAASTGLMILLADAAGSRAAGEIRCEESLRHVFQMAEMYSADNGGYIVRMLDRDRQGRMEFWAERFRLYAKDFRDFSCPANLRHGATAFEPDDLLSPYFYLSDVSFGINGHISGMDTRYSAVEKTANLEDPSYTVYFGDSNTMRLRAIQKLWFQDWAPVHEGVMQSVMADGHIERFTGETLGTYGKIDGWQWDPARWKKWKSNLIFEVKK